MQDFAVTFFILAGGTVLASLVIVMLNSALSPRLAYVQQKPVAIFDYH